MNRQPILKQARRPGRRGLSSEFCSRARLRTTAEDDRPRPGSRRCRDPRTLRLSGSSVCRSRLHRPRHDRSVLRWGFEDHRLEREARCTSRSATRHRTRQFRQGTPSVQTSLPTLHPKALAAPHSNREAWSACLSLTIGRCEQNRTKSLLLGLGIVYRAFSLTSRGDTPRMRRMCIARWLWWQNPVSRATWPIGSLPLRSRVAACSIRRRMRY